MDNTRSIISGIVCHSRNDADMRIYDEVIGRKVYEKPRLGFVIHPGTKWLDIGANIGAFSLWACSRRATPIAVEPIKENCDVALKNLSLIHI